MSSNSNVRERTTVSGSTSRPIRRRRTARTATNEWHCLLSGTFSWPRVESTLSRCTIYLPNWIHKPMRLIQGYGRHAPSVVPSEVWTTDPPVPHRMELDQATPRVTTEKRAGQDANPVGPQNPLDAPPKNPGKQLLACVPPHVWQSVEPLENSELSPRTNRVTANHSSWDIAVTYPQAMRDQIAIFAESMVTPPRKS